MAFNRDKQSFSASRNSRPGGGGFRPARYGSRSDAGGSRPSFGGKPRFGDRGPVEMHKAICDNCGKECEVPFRPTSGKPIFCSSCFENQRGGSDSRRFEGENSGRANFEEKQMFEAVCDNCGKDCKVPFRPTGDKPVYCSNCFESKNEGEIKHISGSAYKRSLNASPTDELSGSAYKEQFEALNTKLDSILKILESAISEEAVTESSKAEIVNKPKVEKKKKASVKKSPEAEI